MKRETSRRGNAAKNRPGGIFGKRVLLGTALAAVVLVGALGYFFGGGDAWMAVATAPKKKIVRSDSPMAKEAEALFWRTLHGGDYDAVPKTIAALTRAFLVNPNDPDLARRLGFLHAWRILERNRLDTIPDNISESAVLSRYYYEESYQIDPSDIRMMGAVSVIRMLNGLIAHDERLMRDGYFLGIESNRQFPEFNYFTTSAALAIVAHSDPLFKEAVDYQWKLMKSCGSFDDLKENLSREEFAKRNPGAKRVCWDSWIAPHNMKGTLLHMGDILVKNGNWRGGVDIYERIRKVQDFENWPMRDFLEERIRNAESNVEHFRVDYTSRLQEKIVRPAMLIHTGYFCVSCHQLKGTIPPVPNFPARRLARQ